MNTIINTDTSKLKEYFHLMARKDEKLYETYLAIILKTQLRNIIKTNCILFIYYYNISKKNIITYAYVIYSMR